MSIDEYSEKKKKMQKTMQHNMQHNSPKVKAKQNQNKEDNPDRLENLKDENFHLKKKQVDLVSQIKVISTQIKRITERLKSDKVIPERSAQFEKELDFLIEEQVNLKDQKLELMKKVKIAQKKLESVGMDEPLSSHKYNEPVFSAQKYQRTHSAKTAEPKGPNGFTISQEQQLRLMKDQIQTQTRTIQNLKHQIEEMRNQKNPLRDNSHLAETKRQLDIKLIEARQELTTLESDYAVKKSIFSRSKEHHQSLIDQHHEFVQRKANLEKSQRETKAAGSQIDFLRQQIEEIKVEKSRLQSEFDNLMKQPFFRKEADNSDYKKIEELKNRKDKFINETKKSKTSYIKLDQEAYELQQELKHLMQDKDFYNKELKKLHTYMDPTGLTLDQVRSKLQQEDPSLFRQAMEDLRYVGEEPSWEKADFIDGILGGKIKNPELSEENQLKQDIQRVKNERKELATELQKTQDLLRQHVELDKSNNELIQEEIRQYKTQMIREREQMDQYQRLYASRAAQIQNLSKLLGKDNNILTAENLNKLGIGSISNIDEDAMSDFSVMTTESEILPQQNVFDLRISNIKYNQSQINQILGIKDSLPNAVQTFITVDFFNHDTKHTDLSQGYEANFNTIFSFKNIVDDFYLKYLDKEYIIAEIFMVQGDKGKQSEKIGIAKLPLNPLLKNDHSFQVQQIISSIKESEGETIGSLFYRQRMRKPLDTAKKWQKMTQDVLNKKYDEGEKLNLKAGVNVNQLKPEQMNKIFEITIKRCNNLRRTDGNFDPKMMQPFFSYDFYTFDYRSATANGQNPVFEVTKRYEVENNKELVDYFKYQYLKIDFIDEGVDLFEEAKLNKYGDYIGSARIPLKDLLQKEIIKGHFSITNQSNKEVGTVELILHFSNSNSPSAIAANANDRAQTLQTQIIQKELLNKIVNAFCDLELEDLDSVLDMLFIKAKKDTPYKVSIGDLQEFIVKDIKVGISEIDFQLFIRAFPQICNSSGVVDKASLLNVFQDSFKIAKFKKLERDQFQEYTNVKNYSRKTAEHDSRYNDNQAKKLDGDADAKRSHHATTPSFAAQSQMDFKNNEKQKQLNKQGTLNDRDLNFNP